MDVLRHGGVVWDWCHALKELCVILSGGCFLAAIRGLLECYMVRWVCEVCSSTEVLGTYHIEMIVDGQNFCF